jgi:hypothetical protein
LITDGIEEARTGRPASPDQRIILQLLRKSHQPIQMAARALDAENTLRANFNC